MEADRSRLWRTYLVSVPVWLVLGLLDPDPPGDGHIGMRTITIAQAAFAAVGTGIGAGSLWVSAEYGPWSWWSPARAFQRYAAVAFLGLATVLLLVAVYHLFR